MMLSRLRSILFTPKIPIDNAQEIEAVKREGHERTQMIKKKAIARSQKSAKGFEQTGKKVYDVAEKIYLATGQHK